MNQKLEYLRLFLILMFENDDTFINPPLMKKTKTKYFIQGFRRLPLQRTGLSVNNVRGLMNCTFEKDNLNDLIIKINENIMSERDINRAIPVVQDSLRKKNKTLRLLSELVEKVQSDDNYQNVNIDNLRNFIINTTGSACVPSMLKIVTKDGLRQAQREARIEGRAFDQRNFNICQVGPDAHTCFNRTTIPNIENLDKMAEYFVWNYGIEESGYSLA